MANTKFGFNDYEWMDVPATQFGKAVIDFNRNGFIGAMKRKTWTEEDEHYYNCMKEMIAMIEEHKKEIEKK